MRESRLSENAQQVGLNDLEGNIAYSPEMLSFEDLNHHFKIKKYQYDRIVALCELLDENLDQKLEFQIAPYEKKSIACKLIKDLINRRIYYYKGWIDMEAYKEKKYVIPHGPGTLYNNKGQFQQGYFKNGQLDGLGRSIYENYGWHQGEYSYGKYHGAGVVWRGDDFRVYPVTTTHHIEIGTWDQFLREDQFTIITPEQEVWKAKFKNNDLQEITEDLSGTDTFKKIKDVNDKFWSLKKFTDDYAGDAQTLLDYLDEAINNPYVEPDLKLIKQSLIKVLNSHKNQISNIEKFALIKWEQTILNDMDRYVKVLPEEYEKILDKETGVEIQEIVNNLRWQSSEMLRVLTDNIRTFQTSNVDLQGALIKVNKIGEDLSNATGCLESKFNIILDQHNDNSLDDHLVKESSTTLKHYYLKLENAVQELSGFITDLTKKFRDKEYEITQKFTQKSCKT